MEVSDERYVNIQTRRVLDLGNREAIYRVALLVADQIDLTDLFAVRRTLEHHLKTAKTATFTGTVGEDVSTDPSREDPPHDERRTGPYTHFVQAVASRVVVGREHDDACRAHTLLKVRYRH